MKRPPSSGCRRAPWLATGASRARGWPAGWARQGGSMGEQPGDRVQSLFDQAVVLPAERRGAFLDAACAGDAVIRAEVESLLACDGGFTEGDDGEGLLKSPL